MTDENYTDMTCAACGQVIGWHVAYHYREDGSVVHSLCPPRVGDGSDIDDLLAREAERWRDGPPGDAQTGTEVYDLWVLTGKLAAALQAARDENEQLQAKLDEATKAKWWTPTTEGP